MMTMQTHTHTDSLARFMTDWGNYLRVAVAAALDSMSSSHLLVMLFVELLSCFS